MKRRTIIDVTPRLLVLDEFVTDTVRISTIASQSEPHVAVHGGVLNPIAEAD